MQIANSCQALFKLAFAPLVWSAHFVICYALVSLDCALSGGWSPAAIICVTVIALLMLAWSGWSNFRHWRLASLAEGTERPMQAFYALNSFLLCALSALALAWVAMPVLVLPPCAS